MNVSSKHVNVCNWGAKYFVGTEFDVNCVGLNFGELECYVVRTILIAHGSEWTIVLICRLASQRKCKHIVD